MKMALNGKRKLGFVNGTIPRPAKDANPELIASWECVNDIVSSWILNSISKEIAASVIYADSVTALWNDLHTRFKQSNGPRMFQLKKSLVSLSQGTLSVTQFIPRSKLFGRNCPFFIL